MSNTGKQIDNGIFKKRNGISADDYSQDIDEVDSFLNSSESHLRLPKEDGESIVYQFFRDKKKRKLVSRLYTDPVTKEVTPLTEVQYIALDPYHPEHGERPLDVPKTLAVQIESNIAKGICLEEITRNGTGPNTARPA